MHLSANHFTPSGTADTVAVYLHGFGSTQSGRKALYLRDRLLAAGIAYSTFDFRGHGQSGGTMRDLTLTGLLEDCAQIIEPLSQKYSRVALIGSSMGALTAAWYARLNPGLIAANILIAPAFNFVELLIEQMGPERTAEWEKRGVIGFQNEYSRGELDYELVREQVNYPLDDLLSNYSTPTLIIHGMLDESVSYRHSLRFVEYANFSGMNLMLVKDGDHRLTDHKEAMGDWIETAVRRHGEEVKG